MGPLSAVAIAVNFLLLGLTEGGWATISGKVLGVVLIVGLVVILVDTFWWYTRGRSVASRAPAGTTQA